jgi:hypothetical protein
LAESLKDLPLEQKRTFFEEAKQMFNLPEPEEPLSEVTIEGITVRVGEGSVTRIEEYKPGKFSVKTAEGFVYTLEDFVVGGKHFAVEKLLEQPCFK